MSVLRDVSDVRLRAVAAAPLRIDARYPNVGSRLVSTTAAGAAALAADPQVRAVAPNRPITLKAEKVRPLKLRRQVVPTGVARVGGPLSSAANGDGAGAVDVDVAVLDSGIDPQHPDLDVVGGVDCTGTGTWADAFGHGTHVAGVIGARDDRQGVVGVAPGARLWAVRVLDGAGIGSVASVMCGLGWVIGATATLEVVNLSLQGPGSATCTDGLLGEAVCRAVAAGVVVVAAAGNDATDVAGVQPASVPVAITVSALADTDETLVRRRLHVDRPQLQQLREPARTDGHPAQPDHGVQRHRRWHDLVVTEEPRRRHLDGAAELHE